MFKFAFSVILAGAICQAFVLSMPADSGPSLSQGFEIVGKAAMDIFKSAGELANNLTATVQNRAKGELEKIFSVFRLRMEIIILASGTTKEFSVVKNANPADLRQYQVVATSVEDVFSRLDKMELADELIRQSTREVVKNQAAEKFPLENIVSSLFTALDRNFQAEKGLQGIYKKLREKNEKEIPLPSQNEQKSKSSKKNLSKRLLNFFFSWFIDNRLTTPRDLFILTRSIVELAKNPRKFDQVQRIYEETLLEYSELIDWESKNVSADAVRVVASFVDKLKEKLEKNPSLKEDFLAMQKNVAERNDWNGSIWDLPV